MGTQKEDAKSLKKCSKKKSLMKTFQFHCINYIKTKKITKKILFYSQVDFGYKNKFRKMEDEIIYNTYLGITKVTYFETWSCAAIQQCVFQLKISMANLLQQKQIKHFQYFQTIKISVP